MDVGVFCFFLPFLPAMTFLFPAVTPCLKFLAVYMYELDVLPALIKDIKKNMVTHFPMNWTIWNWFLIPILCVLRQLSNVSMLTQ